MVVENRLGRFWEIFQYILLIFYVKNMTKNICQKFQNIIPFFIVLLKGFCKKYYFQTNLRKLVIL